jgi:hypothetical protein
MLPTDTALDPGRRFLIRLGWIRLFYAVVSGNSDLPTRSTTFRRIKATDRKPMASGVFTRGSYA